jgi:hypothetical protein
MIDIRSMTADELRLLGQSEHRQIPDSFERLIRNAYRLIRYQNVHTQLEQTRNNFTSRLTDEELRFLQTPFFTERTL